MPIRHPAKVILDLEPGGDGYVEGTTFSYAKYHNASTVLFGPDGMLYVGMGDGGGDCNAARPGVPQDVSSPYGKILRLDPKQPAPYAAAGNPFADGGDARVFHYGVRNPFRFSFDSENGRPLHRRSGTVEPRFGRLRARRVDGPQLRLARLRRHSGEPESERAVRQHDGAAFGSTRKNPIFNLAHGSDGGVSNLIVAIVGGKVYRGSAIPSLYGTYLFGEFYPNRPMRALTQCGDQTSPVATRSTRCAIRILPMTRASCPSVAPPTCAKWARSFRVNDGELYLPANGNALLKIVPAP